VSIAQEVPAGLGGVDAFTVLGLAYSPDLTDEEVRSAYLLRLRAVHPDHGGDAGAAAAVTAAYDALRSGVRRGELLAAVTVDREDVPSGRARWRERAGRAPRDSDIGDRARRPGGRPDPTRLAELRRKVAAARAEQGLPPYITDEATLDKIVDLLVVMQQRDASTRPHPPPAEPPASEPDSQRPASAERGRAGAGRPVPITGSWLASGWARVRYGRPWWLAARVALSAVVVLVAQVTAPGDPAVWALGVGALTWLVRTGRFDLAPRARR
jgi:hypothetical protein